MRRATAATLVALAVVVIGGTLGAVASENRRLDSRLDKLQTEVRGEASIRTASGRTLAALDKQATKLRESGLRLEFQVPIIADLTQTTVAVYGGALTCEAARKRWRNYVHQQLIPFVNKHPNLKIALRHDDPHYRATLLDDFPISC